MKAHDWTPPGATVLLASTIIFAVACTDITSGDHEICVSRGFGKDTSEYKYCRDKLREIHNEDEERRIRFLELLVG